MTLTNAPLHEQLGCYGYFGFGSGVQLVALPRADDTDGVLYCNHCPQGPACWQRHRARVRLLLPAATELADRIAKTCKGKDYVLAYAKAVGTPPDKISEPYLVVMMGNMEDGTHVAHDAPPKDRRPGTLAWPLVVLT
jgi:hypothetical protein